MRSDDDDDDDDEEDEEDDGKKEFIQKLLVSENFFIQFPVLQRLELVPY